MSSPIPHGAFRQVTENEARKLAAAGEAVEWDEGCGWIVYDAKATEQFKAALERKASV